MFRAQNMKCTEFNGYENECVTNVKLALPFCHSLFFFPDIVLFSLSPSVDYQLYQMYLTSDQGFFSSMDLMTGGVTYQVMGDDMGVELPNQVASFQSNPGPSRPRFSFTRSASATAVRPCNQSPKMFQR